MRLLHILIYAVIQGFAELLPVSSSAHVIAAASMLREDPTTPPFVLLLVMLHTGTMFAVIVYFWRAWKRTFFHSQVEFIRFFTKITIATAITGILGLGLLKGIEKMLDPGYTSLVSWRLKDGDSSNKILTRDTPLTSLIAADDPEKARLFKEGETLRLMVKRDGESENSYRDCLIKSTAARRLADEDAMTTDVASLGDLADVFQRCCGITVSTTPARFKAGVRIGVAITGAEESDTTVTITAANTFKPGQPVLISDVLPAGYNGTFQIVAANPKSFTYVSATSGLAPASAFGTASSNIAPLTITANDGKHLKLMEGGFTDIVGQTRIGFLDVTRRSVEHLFKKLDLMAAALAAAGVLIFLAGVTIRLHKHPRKGITTSDGVWIGLIQGLCLPFRGFSRSGATISLGLLRGITRQRAEEFSFALAVVLTPPVLAYEAYKLIEHVKQTSPVGISRADFMPGLKGMAFSFIAGLIALKLLSKLLEKGQWWLFGVYCLAASAGIYWLHLNGYGS
jgi:undecaprenyl pyrophosphate phosphatase UppP